jgi:hypothetical protein
MLVNYQSLWGTKRAIDGCLEHLEGKKTGLIAIDIG